MIALTLIYVSVAMIVLAMLLSVLRLLRGPTGPDRILALDTLAINAVAILVVFSIYAGHTHNFEVALLIAMTGFIGTVALCKYILRGDIIE
jgi:multicomponent K+:H+ antiporter subunit F